ncbi:MAG: hypothetical protein JXR77_14550 [Lentisphaeria bacterium]|nr:hypothetical protein [Lentisphaeria bacterium]
MTATRHFKVPSQGHSHGASSHAPVVRQRSADRGAAALAVGILGWLAVGLALLSLALSLSRRRASMAEVRAGLEPGLKEIQDSVEPRRLELVQEKERLTAAVNDLIKRQEDLVLRLKGLELTVRELEPQVVTLTRTREKLGESVESLAADQTLTGEGVEALQQKLADLERNRDRLKENYRTRFSAMRALYEKNLDDPDPDRMRQFYSAHRHTVFAPAAGFYAGEKLFAAKRSADALRLYKEVARLYPKSLYAREAANRISQIEAGGKYSEPAGPIDFEPYLPYAAEQP